MYYFVFAYLTLGIFVARWCIRFNQRHGVESTFAWQSMSSMGELLGGLLISPFVVMIVLPFAIAFWPLLCLWDILEIPQKKRKKRQQEQEALNEQKIRSAANNSVAATTDRQQSLIGKVGVTIGTLSPMGKIRIDNEAHEATSRGEYISEETTVVVTGVRGSTLEVALPSTTGQTCKNH